MPCSLNSDMIFPHPNRFGPFPKAPDGDRNVRDMIHQSADIGSRCLRNVNVRQPEVVEVRYTKSDTSSKLLEVGPGAEKPMVDRITQENLKREAGDSNRKPYQNGAPECHGNNDDSSRKRSVLPVQATKENGISCLPPDVIEYRKKNANSEWAFPPQFPVSDMNDTPEIITRRFRHRTQLLTPQLDHQIPTPVPTKDQPLLTFMPSDSALLVNVTSDGGVKKLILEAGPEALPLIKIGCKVRFTYRVSTLDIFAVTLMDVSNRQRPAVIHVGSGDQTGLILGLEVGLLSMRKGEAADFVIAPEYGFKSMCGILGIGEEESIRVRVEILDVIEPVSSPNPLPVPSTENSTPGNAVSMEDYLLVKLEPVSKLVKNADACRITGSMEECLDCLEEAISKIEEIGLDDSRKVVVEPFDIPDGYVKNFVRSKLEDAAAHCCLSLEYFSDAIKHSENVIRLMGDRCLIRSACTRLAASYFRLNDVKMSLFYAKYGLQFDEKQPELKSILKVVTKAMASTVGPYWDGSWKLEDWEGEPFELPVEGPSR